MSVLYINDEGDLVVEVTIANPAEPDLYKDGVVEKSTGMFDRRVETTVAADGSVTRRSTTHERGEQRCLA